MEKGSNNKYLEAKGCYEDQDSYIVSAWGLVYSKWITNGRCCYCYSSIRVPLDNSPKLHHDSLNYKLYLATV